jgi:hypothetical protein
MPRLHPDLSKQSQFSKLHFFFPVVETALKGKRFQDVEGIKRNVTAELNVVPFEAFADSFQKLLKRFNKYIQVDGDYVEQKWNTFYITVYFLFIFSHQSGNFIASPPIPDDVESHLKRPWIYFLFTRASQ